MRQPLKLLIIDDSETDAEILVRHLTRADFRLDVERYWDLPRIKEALKSEAWDLILCDHRLPAFDSGDVLMTLRDMGLSDTPFILVSGVIEVEAAVEAMRLGANDFILKDDLSRLVPAIHRELEQAETRREKQRAEIELRESNHKLRSALKALAESQERLISAERFRALGQMASGIAHDFNNSLTKILGIAEVLAARNPEETDLFRQLKTVISDATATVRRLCQFYRQSPAERAKPIEVNGLLHDVRDFTRPRWQKPVGTDCASVQMAVTAQATSLAMAEASQLREIMTNLIFNSYDAMPEGGLIELISRDVDQMVEIEVRDNGSGMSPEVVARSQEPLFTTKGEKGTGMGLAIANSIVQSYGGTLRVESELGKGTSVILSLRRGKSASGTEGRAIPAPENRETVGSQIRILVIDDEPLIANLFKWILQDMGHQVTAVTDPKEVPSLVSTNGFDLVVSDLSMPDVTGDRLAKSLREIAPQTRFILATGFGDLLHAHSETLEGVDLILPKPASREDLVRALNSLFPASTSESSGLVELPS